MVVLFYDDGNVGSWIHVQDSNHEMALIISYIDSLFKFNLQREKCKVRFPLCPPI